MFVSGKMTLELNSQSNLLNPSTTTLELSRWPNQVRAGLKQLISMA